MAARYLRYIVFAFVCLVILFFISSSSGPSPVGDVGERFKSTTQNWREKIKGSQPDSVDLKEDINKIPPPAASPPKTSLPVEPVEPPKDDETLDTENTAESDSEKTIKPTNPQKSFQHKTDTSTKKPVAGKMNATFVTLARNSDVWDISESIKQVEDRFNHQYNYDWVFLNDKPFDDDFKKVTTALVSGKTRYGLIPHEHWSYPDWIDQEKAKEAREDMDERHIIYGGSESYRHMCRFESGFFYRQPLMMEYEWYWRVEPSIKLYCDVPYDPFEFMAKNKKKYSFVISLHEYRETIDTLWDSVKTFIGDHPEHLAKDNSMEFLSDDGGKSYNLCHFWSNFEIGNLNWLRSQAYTDFFDQLDKDGGFFYERWGDAPVHSIAAALLLNKDELHFFEDFGYWHVPFSHCPNEEKTRLERRCRCDPGENFDWNGYSCTAKYYEMMGWEHPDPT